VAKRTQPARPAGTPAAERELRTQGRRTMSKLLDAGMKVLQERGYHAARVDDIVRRARTSHGTFYLYFANKHDLLRALAVECAAEMQALADDIGTIGRDDQGWAELRRWVEGFDRTYRKYGAVLRVWMEVEEGEAGDPEMVELGTGAMAQIVATLVDRMRAAEVEHLPDLELAATALLAMLERFTYFVSSRSVPFDDDEMLDTLTTMVHRGFFAASA
jgi:AcrR family transcriptional regulator